MYVTVHRGSEQIGGSVIEIGSGQTRLIFDAGTNLPPIDDREAADDFQLEGLTFGKTDFQGVFISHHHNDHCGLLDRILPKIPVYAGELTERVLHTIADFTGQARPSIYDHLADGQVIQKGNLQITPILTKHSAREAYMFLVQGDEKNVLYTGDFRSVDSIVEQVRGLLNGKPLHLLISEGTNIRADRRGREERFPDEDSIQAEAAKWMREYNGTVFVLCSSTNEDRIQAISRAAQESGRLYYEDYFQAILRGRESEPIRHFVARGVCKQSPQYPQFQRLLAQKKLIGAETLAQRPRKKVIFVRASMQDFMKKYLEARKKKLGIRGG